jgi:adenine deaminase
VIEGKVLYSHHKTNLPKIKHTLPNNFNTGVKKLEDIQFRADAKKIYVIEAIDGELITKKGHYQTQIEFFESDVAQDILKIVVVNRYKDAPPAISFVKGFGLKKGAIASSVAHDSHNIIAVGCSDKEILQAVNRVIENKGGIVGVHKEERHELPLKIAGIISDKEGSEVAQSYKALNDFVKTQLESSLHAPFMTLSFMALLVIPEIKLSDKGLFDGNSFSFISPFSS